MAQITQELDKRCKICQDKSYRVYFAVYYSAINGGPHTDKNTGIVTFKQRIFSDFVSVEKLH